MSWAAKRQLVILSIFLLIGLIILFIVYRSFFVENKTTLDLFQSFLVVLSIYFFTSTTVHPWYVINLVLVGIFTKYNYPIIWSLTAILSYSAYSNSEFKEHFWLIGLEYSIVILFFIFERFRNLKRT